jgi:hypothetical protein
VNTVPEIWSEEALLRKARVCVERASNGPSELWSLLGLELLARAAVAKIHPALLADPQEGAHLLHAFGFGRPGRPRSVPIKTVLARCHVVVGDFSEKLMKDARALMELRNEELHTGGMALEELRSSSWQPQYYEICQVLLAHLNLELGDFFPAERAYAARTILQDLARDVESTVKQRIADSTRRFAGLDPDQRAAQLARRIPTVAAESAHLRRERIVACPACSFDATVAGETATISQPRVGEDDIERDVTILPTKLRCPVCELNLDGHAELHHAGCGDEFVVTENEDPLEHYGIDPADYVSIEDFVEPDYGND